MIPFMKILPAGVRKGVLAGIAGHGDPGSSAELPIAAQFEPVRLDLARFRSWISFLKLGNSSQILLEQFLHFMSDSGPELKLSQMEKCQLFELARKREGGGRRKGVRMLFFSMSS